VRLGFGLNRRWILGNGHAIGDTQGTNKKTRPCHAERRRDIESSAICPSCDAVGSASRPAPHSPVRSLRAGRVLQVGVPRAPSVRLEGHAGKTNENPRNGYGGRQGPPP
jgi:hypothetical protein